MPRKKFKLSHSIVGIAALLLMEAGLAQVFASVVGVFLVLVLSALGALSLIYVSTEVIEEVRGARHMLLLLSAVTVEFIVFFAFQYYFMQALSPVSFPSLSNDWVSLALSSVMVFVFNPLYLPTTVVGKALLLINTLSALGLVLFILQNVWQFKRNSNES